METVPAARPRSAVREALAAAGVEAFDGAGGRLLVPGAPGRVTVRIEARRALVVCLGDAQGEGDDGAATLGAWRRDGAELPFDLRPQLVGARVRWWAELPLDGPGLVPALGRIARALGGLGAAPPEARPGSGDDAAADPGPDAEAVRAALSLGAPALARDGVRIEDGLEVSVRPAGEPQRVRLTGRPGGRVRVRRALARLGPGLSAATRAALEVEALRWNGRLRGARVVLDGDELAADFLAPAAPSPWRLGDAVRAVAAAGARAGPSLARLARSPELSAIVVLVAGLPMSPTRTLDP